MLKRFLDRLLPKPAAAAEAPLPTIDPAEIEPLLYEYEGLPRVDWQQAGAWAIARQDQMPIEDARRALTAAWLDVLSGGFAIPYTRWRSPDVEGLAPAEGHIAARTAAAARESMRCIRESLTPIRGGDPIPPIAVLALASGDDYYSFVCEAGPEEGEFATSGAQYWPTQSFAPPLIIINAAFRHAVEASFAHELAHHALNGYFLPIWIEEGLTQMMEERVTGASRFHLDREMLDRHRSLWYDIGLDGFFDGSTFRSPEDDRQELSYHLAQCVTRTLLSTRPKDFFAFARACKTTDVTAAAVENLGGEPEAIVRAMLRVR